MSDIIFKNPWQIWIAPKGSEFITSDSPVLTLRFDQWGQYYVGDGFARTATVAVLPLCPKACLFAGLQEVSSRSIPDGDVWEINKAIISSASRFIYARSLDKRLDSLVQKQAGTIKYGIDAFKAATTDEVFDLLF